MVRSEYLHYLERQKYKNCNESQSDEVNSEGSIPVWSGGMDFEEMGQKQNRSFWNVVEKNA